MLDLGHGLLPVHLGGPTAYPLAAQLEDCVLGRLLLVKVRLAPGAMVVRLAEELLLATLERLQMYNVVCRKSRKWSSRPVSHYVHKCTVNNSKVQRVHPSWEFLCNLNLLQGHL